MRTSFLPCTFLVGLLLVAPLGSQERPARPEGWPDAATVLERYKAGDERHASRSAIGMCPERNPYGDTLWKALLAERPTPELTYRLSATWAPAIRDCGDPRIDVWYRERLVEYRHNPSLAINLFAGLAVHPTPMNVEAIKQHVFDESVDEKHRSAILFYWHASWSWEQKLELYFETYRRTRAIPEPYARSTFWNLLRGAVADRFIRRSLETIERSPEGPNPARLLHRLAMHPEVEKNPVWRAQVEAVLARIEANTSGSFPEVLVTTARQGREHLRRRPEP